jgi:hypothetical protein
MSTISATGTNWLQSIAPGGNWLQSASASASGTSDWMDPSASSDDPVADAANAFAAAEQVDTTDVNTLVVNEGISSAETQLAGQSVDIQA